MTDSTSNPPNSPWPGPRKRRDGEFQQKREAVIATAARLFQEKGYENTTLNAIAEALNVTKPTLYYYVENKSEILEECRTRTRDGIAAAMQQAEDQGRHGLEKIEMFIRAYAETISSDYGKVLIASFRSSDEEAGIAHFRAGLRQTDHLLRAFLEEGMKDGSIAPCDPKLAAFAIFGALNWITFWYEPGGPADPDQIATEFTRLFRNGLAPR
ncbi:TetR/AcrR family transcriptional regulator [Zavarzinia sp. CC-PAN008]|uniref:TetR/AcrR family transcriptional regulator n=1 Tax=Zavarzinia sp. CC-PAN008 TaxID=3243332 RepID=UPI003F74707C